MKTAAKGHSDTVGQKSGSSSGNLNLQNSV